MEVRGVNNENGSSNIKEPVMRITRARAKALGISIGLYPLCPFKQDDKQGLRRESKREADNLGGHNRQKKRTVLKDVTNITCEKLYMNFKNAARKQKKGKPSSFRFAEASEFLEPREKEESQEICTTINSTSESEFINLRMASTKSIIPANTNSSKRISPNVPKHSLTVDSEDGNQWMKLQSLKNRRNVLKHSLTDDSEDGKLWMKLQSLKDRGIIDIDTKSNNQQMCVLYAADIYDHLYAKEVDQRPCAAYMEKLQKDITKGMRGILIDWLVEVSEEYRLVPDTLYLTVNLIDRYLSDNYIEKKKLQLLGVTCMLIASKYEEICAPRVEEFCFITDSTYTKEEVVKMESRVLNFLRFQLSVPTAKKFLRRFIQAAQVSYEVPSVELEFLSNYLAELSLTDYTFLKFLPSLIAASAVFLARWTLDHKHHPWNSTLEHYTRYKATELQTTVVELQNLQLNTTSTLNAIREKYKQPKFKGVSTLHSSQSVQSLFES